MTVALRSSRRLSRMAGALILALGGVVGCQDAAPPPSPAQETAAAARSAAPPTCDATVQQIDARAAGMRGTVQRGDGSMQVYRADGSPLPLRPEDLRIAVAADGSTQAWLGYGLDLIPISEPACIEAVQAVIGLPDEAALERSDAWAEAIRERHAAGDPAGVVVLLREAAEARLDWAMTALGLTLLRGEGVSADRDAAIRWFQQAARQSHAEALYQLGGLYAQAAQGEADEARILHLLSVARALGHAKAAAMLQAIGH